jgi:hypothetical protein
MDYPKSALKIKFKALGGKCHIYRIWKSDSGWCWAALGNSGAEDTMEAAMRTAREWILFGVSGLAKRGSEHESRFVHH